MTEEEWPTDHGPLRWFAAQEKAGPRERRLYACGCCRLVWPLLPDERSRIAVGKLEGYADDLGNDCLRQDAYDIAHAALRDIRASDHAGRAAAYVVGVAAYPIVPAYLSGNLRAALRQGLKLYPSVARRTEAGLIRDIFGNPFRPVTVEPDWRTPTVVGLARGIYADRAFDRLPILADALDDAGCTHPGLIGHLRDSALAHVRGCWAVDLLLDLS